MQNTQVNSHTIPKKSRMKRHGFCKIIPYLIALSGIVLILLSISAESLEIDADSGWGPYRIAILLMGITMSVFPIISTLVDWLDRRLINSPIPRRKKLKVVTQLKSRYLGFVNLILSRVRRVNDPTSFLARFINMPRSKPRRLLGDTSKACISHLQGRGGLIALSTFTLFVYVGIVSVWQWTSWPRTTNYYDMLGEAFSLGQSHLSLDPSPSLAELDDPYIPDERQEIPYIWDSSYFEGKYYLYWGPVPAILIAPIKYAFNVSIGDEIVVFVSISLVFLISILILGEIRKRFFSTLPDWLFALGLISVGLSYPLLWALSWPTIYPAAIACGQAFLLASLYFALPILNQTSSSLSRHLLIGILLAMAIGSRLTLLGAAVILALGLIAPIFLKAELPIKRTSRLLRSITMLIPFFTGISMLGIYNYLRFGSLIETGIRYQLSRHNLNVLQQNGGLFNINYLIPNLLYYLFTPLHSSSRFPFLRPIWGKISILESNLRMIDVPPFHYVEVTTGLVFTIPTLIITLYVLYRMVCSKYPEGQIDEENYKPSRGRNRHLNYLVWLILLMSLFAAIPTILFFWVSVRYLIDFIPLLSLVVVIGFWILYDSSKKLVIRRSLSAILIICLSFTAISISFLITCH